MKKEKISKPKKKIFRKIILVIIIIILIIFAFKMLTNFFYSIKDKKMTDKINSLSKEKIDYAFIEINPSIVLSLKDGKVNDVACLNNDCIKIYNDIDVIGKDIDYSVEFLYNLANQKGYDTSNGVKVKTTGNFNIDKDYVSIEYIDESTKNELIEKVVNNDSIKESSNDNYYNKLWEELKKDNEYGIIYECNMNGDELECHIKNDFVIASETEVDENDYAAIISIWNKALNQMDRVARVLKKFGVPIEADIEILALTNPMGILNYHGSKLTIENYATTEDIIYSGKIRCDIYEVHLNDINLLKPTSFVPTLYLEEDEEQLIEGKTETTINEYQCLKGHCLRVLINDTPYCNYYEDAGYGDWNRNIEQVYQFCDMNYENCYNVSREEFMNY